MESGGSLSTVRFFIFSCISGWVTSAKKLSSNSEVSRRISARPAAVPRISGLLSTVSSKNSQIAWLSISVRFFSSSRSTGVRPAGLCA
ncbi:hypothetical protein D3C83_49750 [compost metagenome]